MNNRRKVETYICASPLTIKAPFTVRILYGMGRTILVHFVTRMGTFSWKEEYICPPAREESLFLLAFYTRLLILIRPCIYLIFFLSCVIERFFFFLSPVVIKFFVERLFLIFLLFFCSRSSIICNEITIKMIEKCRNVRFIMVDRESFRKYAMVVKGRRKPHTFHIYGQRGSACRETKGGLCHSLNGAWNSHEAIWLMDR